MTSTTREPGVRGERAPAHGRGLAIGAVALAVIVASYPASYAVCRATHVLVHRGGGSITHGGGDGGFALSWEELAYLPMILAEETIRGAMDPTW